MKRSEMIQKLKELSFQPTEEYWSNVLSALETLGMKPPERVYWNRNPDGSLRPSSKNGDMVNEWETE